MPKSYVYNITEKRTFFPVYFIKRLNFFFCSGKVLKLDVYIHFVLVKKHEKQDSVIFQDSV